MSARPSKAERDRLRAVIDAQIERLEGYGCQCGEATCRGPAIEALVALYRADSAPPPEGPARVALRRLLDQHPLCIRCGEKPATRWNECNGAKRCDACAKLCGGLPEMRSGAAVRAAEAVLSGRAAPTKPTHIGNNWCQWRFCDHPTRTPKWCRKQAWTMARKHNGTVRKLVRS